MGNIQYGYDAQIHYNGNERATVTEHSIGDIDDADEGLELTTSKGRIQDLARSLKYSNPTNLPLWLVVYIDAVQRADAKAKAEANSSEYNEASS